MIEHIKENQFKDDGSTIDDGLNFNLRFVFRHQRKSRTYILFYFYLKFIFFTIESHMNCLDKHM